VTKVSCLQRTSPGEAKTKRQANRLPFYGYVVLPMAARNNYGMITSAMACAGAGVASAASLALPVVGSSP
jgi:hypothetical protein